MFVFTQDQVKAALVEKCAALGFITKSVADLAAANPGVVKVTPAENGVIIELGTGGAPTPPTSTLTAAVTATSKRPGQKPGRPRTVPPPSTDPKVEGPSSESVKAALVAVMAHPPGLNTIGVWDAKQRRAAIKWAKDPSQPRPEFIVERKTRTPRKSAPPPPPEQTETQAVAPEETSASSESESFFDEPTADATDISLLGEEPLV